MTDGKHSVLWVFAKGAAGAAGSALFLWFMGWLKPVWSFVHQALSSLVTHLMAQSQRPNWSAYLVSLWVATALLRWAVMNWRNRKDNHNRFNQFKFLGAVWRLDGMSSLPYGLRPYCPAYELLLACDETGGGYSGAARRVELHCERCGVVRTNEQGGMAYSRERLHREIDRLVRTGEWRRHADGI